MPYIVTPEGLLFFRDARPLDADKASEHYRAIGHGANWPRPDHFYNAVMHGLINEAIKNEDCPVKVNGHFPFGGLKTIGPFPVQKKENGEYEIYFPRPLDVDMNLEKLEAGTNMPEPLTYGFIDRKEGKKSYKAWISAETYKKYLADGSSKDQSSDELIEAIAKENTLFSTEFVTGTTIDATTGASKRVKDRNKTGQYQGEYLRLNDDVSFWCDVELENKSKTPVNIPSKVIMGGQGGVVSITKTDAIDLMKKFEKPNVSNNTNEKIFVRWTLLTPAYFSQTGWLPGFCKDTTKDASVKKDLGVVMLQDCNGAKLVGACVGKAIYFSGWDTEEKQKPTVMCVPAGSSYVFECNNAETANTLINKLHLERRSDFGSQGFGIGVCSIVVSQK